MSRTMVGRIDRIKREKGHHQKKCDSVELRAESNEFLVELTVVKTRVCYVQ